MKKRYIWRKSQSITGKKSHVETLSHGGTTVPVAGSEPSEECENNANACAMTFGAGREA